MKLLTKADVERLQRNGHRAEEDDSFDPCPVVKLFTPDAGATWLLAWVDAEDPDLAFGLCDLGLGHPELGYVRLSEIRELRGKLGLPVERDRHWQAEATLGAYARAASGAGRIIDP